MQDNTKVILMAYSQSPIYDKAIVYAIKTLSLDDLCDHMSRKEAEERGVYIPTIYTFLPSESSCIVTTHYNKVTYSNLWGRLSNCIADYYAGFADGIIFMRPIGK